ncbi:hypothetical protein HNY73_007292 [Argiope bruennichi]|uniref:Uncharacterized protein n=1 Tax=Argiope bruennichi TaxID=94029 RepID=A0A8T0FEG7_ARGBR|nr:hypothetical protein HNY73_007292 [Argiope bruennichi]
MMTKTVARDRIADKRNKWAIFEELHDTNERLDEAVSILDDLKVLIKQLPNKLATNGQQADALIESAMLLDNSIDNCLEATGAYFDEIEMKLDEMQKSLLHDEVSQMHRFTKLVTEVRCTQKRIDTLIAKAEEEIYKFLESEDFYVERQKKDVRIMQIVLSCS